MTAEVVVMNTGAVAMAADSAATITSDKGKQTSLSANKLFNLSYDHSVGIMIYNVASFYSVPWETIIKVYREQAKIAHFPTLLDYVDNFVEFLESEKSWLFPKELLDEDLLSIYTGIVFAGFGKEEVFPSVYYFETNGFVAGKLSKKDDDYGYDAINHLNRSSTTAFAQRDMVDTFMRGIRPTHEGAIMNVFIDAVTDVLPEIIDIVPDAELSPQRKSELKAEMSQAAVKVLSDSMQEVNQIFFNTYTRDIVNGMAFLTKDELADVAGALLRLSTLHKQLSLGDDTVAGPIDIAVISKGEGMIWIDRKHYFDKDLNPQYFKRFKDK